MAEGNFMNTAKRLKDLEIADNVETQKLYPILEDFLSKIKLPFDDAYGRAELISKLEFRSRDGFTPFAHNQGGMDLLAVTDDFSLVASGEYIGLKIETQVQANYDSAWKEVQENYPELSEDAKLEKLDDQLRDDYSGVAYRVRVMYEGAGVLMVYAGYDDDAPYFRWTNAADVELKIKFKNKRELKTKLGAALKKIEAAQ
jgi:hypothetical protein